MKKEVAKNGNSALSQLWRWAGSDTAGGSSSRFSHFSMEGVSWGKRGWHVQGTEKNGYPGLITSCYSLPLYQSLKLDYLVLVPYQIF